MHSFIDRVTNQRPASGTSHQLTMPKRFQLNVPVIQTILAPYQLSPYAVNSLASSLHRTQCHHSSTASVRTLVIIGQARKVGNRIKSSSFLRYSPATKPSPLQTALTKSLRCYSTSLSSLWLLLSLRRAASPPPSPQWPAAATAAVLSVRLRLHPASATRGPSNAARHSPTPRAHTSQGSPRISSTSQFSPRSPPRWTALTSSARQIGERSWLSSICHAGC